VAEPRGRARQTDATDARAMWRNAVESDFTRIASSYVFG
jgi:hypothetical protein